MKNRFSKKVFLSLLMVLALGVFLSGCGATTTIVAPPTATTCTVIITSQSNLVWGQSVYMDGQQQPSTLLVPWGSVQINNVTVGVRHNFAIIQGNTFSKMEFLTTVPGTNYIDFYWF
jgi:uncharacterized lipoprotein YajG